MDTILQDILPVLPARLHAPLRHLEHLRPEDIRLVAVSKTVDLGRGA